MSAYTLVAKHVEATLAEAESQSISGDVMARNLVMEAVRIFKQQGRPLPDIAAELVAEEQTYAAIKAIKI